MKVKDSLGTIIKQMKTISKPIQQFLLALSQAFLCVQGRYNFRNLARYTPFCEHTMSRSFGKAFDFAACATSFFDLFFPQDTFIAALDATFITKSGKHTFGKDKFFSSWQGKAGLELSLLSLVSVEKKTAFALQVQQTEPGLKDKLAFYLAQVEKVKDFLLKRQFIW